MDLEALVRQVVEAEGLEFVDVGFVTEEGRKTLRVTADRDGGLDIGSIAQLSDKLARRFDLESFDAGGYVLEVSSPGLERPLREPTDFMKKVGDKVKVKVAAPDPETFRGRLVSADETHILVATEQGERQVAYTDIVAAKTVFEWGDGK